MLDQLIFLKFTHVVIECKDDKVCLQRDPNSHCYTLEERAHCVCKSSYHLDISNRTGKCVYGEPSEEIKEGLTAAPIILCFMGCVIVEAVCLLAFHYWKKHRRTAFISSNACRLQAVGDVRFHIQDRGPMISFTVTPEMESTISDNRTSSPPPYSQTIVSSNNVSQNEEPPPPYDEAVKQCEAENLEMSCADKSNQRKMSF